MFSNKTLLDLIRLTDPLSIDEVDRINIVFNFSRPAPYLNTSKSKKVTSIYSQLRLNEGQGPFTDNIQLDYLQYIIDDFFRKRPQFQLGSTIEYTTDGSPINFKNAFSRYNQEVSNNLKRDGYIVEGQSIKKLLPQEIEEAKIESEMMSALEGFKFLISKGHLIQAISNHSQGNWAGANSQFRTFIESLLVDISNKLLPNNLVSTTAKAIKLLSETANPPFLRKDLNEIPTDKEDSFVYGLWVRLHPDGSHPGLSDEDDCTFRYHVSIVFANYLLRRLKSRIFLNK